MQNIVQKRLTIDRLCDEGCINLLKVFLKQLAKEYVRAFAIYSETPGNKGARKHYEVLKELFTSQYFTDITTLDGQMIIAELERKYRSAH